MSRYNKISKVLLLLVWIVFYCLPVAAMESLEAPESVTIGYLQELYEEVQFDHKAHVEMYRCSSCHHHTLGSGTENENCQKCHLTSVSLDDVSCSACHISTIAAVFEDKEDTVDSNIYHIDKPSLKGAFHLQCLGCHRAESGPTDCQDCHAFTLAGQVRFSLKN